MPKIKQSMKMPELFVFARILFIWFILTGVFRVAYEFGERFRLAEKDIDWRFWLAVLTACAIIVIVYCVMRGVLAKSAQLIRSVRLDLLGFATIGVWSNKLTSSWLEKVRNFIDGADHSWAPTILAALSLTLLTPVIRQYFTRINHKSHQLNFLSDEEIQSDDEDVLGSSEIAKKFANMVLASKAHSGLVFGIDGPWGVGKTSFIKLAERHWQELGGNSVIVFRFEPLRYAAEPDLSERLIRDLTDTIQRQVYAPEFRPAATRYSRMIKGFSLFGVRLSIESQNETIDELLEDIDNVLKSIHRRVIVVIDDLDRLDAKAVNNVLFAIRRTFKLSQAAYILCYDTENLLKSKGDSENAREFLEKFINVKLSLFVDCKSLRNFLLRDWADNNQHLPAIPSDLMLRKSSMLNVLAEILSSGNAPNYLSLIGDIRKLKRFVNAIEMLGVDDATLYRSDFNPNDLVNLILLNMNYPELFRRIYYEETEGRSGIFSVNRLSEEGQAKFSNNKRFDEVLKEYDNTSQFLLRQLFDVKELKVESIDLENSEFIRSRACFNGVMSYRNLEKYLMLIVRLEKPKIQDTFIFYKDAVDRVKNGEKIAQILEESEFRLQINPEVHDKFWGVLIDNSYEFTRVVAEDTINTLLAYIPSYYSISFWSQRKIAIHSLISLLDRAGWGRTDGRRLNNSPENIVEIAHRIFGEGKFADKGILRLLASEGRGTLGWHDLLLFRLLCSADLQGKTFNLHRALIVHDDLNAKTDGFINQTTRYAMRTISQKVFRQFQEIYIDSSRNFLTDVDNTRDQHFFGDCESWFQAHREENQSPLNLVDELLAARSAIKTFVLYQLANREEPNGSGVGCGFYDETGSSDSEGISKKMNSYIFDVCFNPTICKENIYHFADHCLRNLTSNYFVADNGEEGHVATLTSLTSGLYPAEMKRYWKEYGQIIKDQNLSQEDRRVVTYNYVETYSKGLPKVFEMLDGMVNEEESVS